MRIILTTPADDTEALHSTAQALADEIRRQVLTRGSIAAVYTAPEAPAAETAAAIAEALSLPDPVLQPALETEGVLDVLSALRRLQATAWTVLEQFKKDHGAEDQILLVVPVQTVQAVVCRALTMPVEDFQRFRLDPGSLTLLEFRVQQNRTLLLSLNETCHLAAVVAS